jgi:hypothetical protein
VGAFRWPAASTEFEPLGHLHLLSPKQSDEETEWTLLRRPAPAKAVDLAKPCLDVVEAEVRKQIERFDAARNYYRNGHFWVTLALATLAALITLLISVGQITQVTWISICALVASAGMTVASAWEGYSRNKEMWVQKTDILNQIYELHTALRYAKIRWGQTSLPRWRTDCSTTLRKS